MASEFIGAQTGGDSSTSKMEVYRADLPATWYSDLGGATPPPPPRQCNCACRALRTLRNRAINRIHRPYLGG